MTCLSTLLTKQKLKKVEDNFFPFLLWYIVVSTILAYFRFPFFPHSSCIMEGKNSCMSCEFYCSASFKTTLSVLKLQIGEVFLVSCPSMFKFVFGAFFLYQEAALLIRNPSFPRVASHNEDSVISDIQRLSPLHFSPRTAEDKLRLFEAMHKRGSIVDSVESNLEQVWPIMH